MSTVGRSPEDSERSRSSWEPSVKVGLGRPLPRIGSLRVILTADGRTGTAESEAALLDLSPAIFAAMASSETVLTGTGRRASWCCQREALIEGDGAGTAAVSAPASGEASATTGFSSAGSTALSLEATGSMAACSGCALGAGSLTSLTAGGSLVALADAAWTPRAGLPADVGVSIFKRCDGLPRAGAATFSFLERLSLPKIPMMTSVS